MIVKSYFLFSVVVLTGCSSTGYNFFDSVKSSASDPMVWTNAGLGLLMTAGDLDQSISDSARKHAYVFGSEKKAADASDSFRAATRWSMNVSGFMVAEDYNAGFWGIAGNTAIRYVTDNLNATVVATTTARIKKATDQDRPNGDCCGFPSGHASRAFATANIAARNYRASYLPFWLQDTAIAGTYMSAYLTAWGRVESGAHYPSQVFLGAAYGVFLSSIINDLTDLYGAPFSTDVSASPDFVGVNFSYYF